MGPHGNARQAEQSPGCQPRVSHVSAPPSGPPSARLQTACVFPGGVMKEVDKVHVYLTRNQSPKSGTSQ